MATFLAELFTILTMCGAVVNQCKVSVQLDPDDNSLMSNTFTIKRTGTTFYTSYYYMSNTNEI